MDTILELIHKIDPPAVFFILTALLGLWYVHRSLRENNPIELWHFYSSKGPDGKQYGDTNKLGILIGMSSSTVYVGWMFYKNEIYNWYAVTIFALWLVFIAGCEYFAKWFRHFLDAKVKEQGAPASLVVETTTTATATPATPPAPPTAG